MKVVAGSRGESSDCGTRWGVGEDLGLLGEELINKTLQW